MHDTELSKNAQPTLCPTSQSDLISSVSLYFYFFWGRGLVIRRKREHIVELLKALRYRLLLMA